MAGQTFAHAIAQQLMTRLQRLLPMLTVLLLVCAQAVDCLDNFTAMQECMSKHPEAFSDIRQSMEAALDHSSGDSKQGKG